MQRLALILLALACATPLLRPAGASMGQDEQAPTELERRKEKARKLLDANGTRAIQERSIEQMLDQFEAMGLSPEFSRRFKDKFDVEEVLDFNVDIHAEELDEETLDGLLAFYATDVGKAHAEALPDITEAALKAGMAYGKRIGEEVAREMK